MLPPRREGRDRRARGLDALLPRPWARRRSWVRCFHADACSPSLSLSRKFLKSLLQKQPQELLLVMGTGVSAAVAPGIPALCSWRSCLEAVIEAAEQLDVLHPGDVAHFRRQVVKGRDLLVVAHDLIRKMSPVSPSQVPRGVGSGPGWASAGLGFPSPRLCRFSAGTGMPEQCSGPGSTGWRPAALGQAYGFLPLSEGRFLPCVWSRPSSHISAGDTWGSGSFSVCGGKGQAERRSARCCRRHC